jgi:hypothetical protein
LDVLKELQLGGWSESDGIISGYLPFAAYDILPNNEVSDAYCSLDGFSCDIEVGFFVGAQEQWFDENIKWLTATVVDDGTESVPEPVGLLGLAVGGAFLGIKRKLSQPVKA